MVVAEAISEARQETADRKEYHSQNSNHTAIEQKPILSISRDHLLSE